MFTWWKWILKQKCIQYISKEFYKLEWSSVSCRLYEMKWAWSFEMLIIFVNKINSLRNHSNHLRIKQFTLEYSFSKRGSNDFMSFLQSTQLQLNFMNISRKNYCFSREWNFETIGISIKFSSIDLEHWECRIIVFKLLNT